ncbi:unnamed protein product [Sphagnum jensenii]|uniref:Uncharacterized protein n=1 Tax=Sphagnum jensenii TaxID=128206 RepID=A0ABP1AAM9_9BRYO
MANSWQATQATKLPEAWAALVAGKRLRDNGPIGGSGSPIFTVAIRKWIRLLHQRLYTRGRCRSTGDN